MEYLGYFAMVLAMVGTYVNAKGNRFCFAIWAISNSVFVVASVISCSWPQAGLFTFNLVMCAKGWRCWSTKG
jgi:nicotinamide riboside transporter PnuC